MAPIVFLISVYTRLCKNYSEFMILGATGNKKLHSFHNVFFFLGIFDVLINYYPWLVYELSKTILGDWIS